MYSQKNVNEFFLTMITINVQQKFEKINQDMHMSDHFPMGLYHLEETRTVYVHEHMTSRMPPRSMRPTGGGYAE